ncbi:thioredoxin family protein [Aquicoccus porphyridii]|uniref:Thioredoxin family protein n=1 Tax=Aquicoccus porphyridii TaxID=1852029 RepID=A0A5A9ZSQ5_9RHOB|nr:thioredoxin family protein [Aquicoccus porphyridii]RAI54900.1 thioredoxin family protein [Rhodobacteraceae bacterium AsT-22]
MSFAPVQHALATVLALVLSVMPAAAAELIMVEQKGCSYCIAWMDTIGPIYPKSPEGRFAPLRVVNIRDGAPDGVRYARPVNFTPTFILVEDGTELGRIEGYPGEDFFWGLLDMLLKRTTDYAGTG